MKKLTALVLKSFIGPFILTFCISMFVLLMQFLWKYIDDLVGKGLDWLTIAELIFFTSATLVPLALPLAILVSSIMTYGNMAEHFEIVAAKSAGVSLQRLMRPLFIVAAVVSALAFYFSNYVLPVANLKMGSLLYDVRQQKPALYIREGIFYNGIDGYSIRAGRKSPDGKKIYNVMVYDHTRGNGNNKVILADSGIMSSTNDQKYLLVTLFSGNSYEEENKRKGKYDTHPLTRVAFKSQLIRFDLSTFKLSRTNEDLFKDNWQMLNFRQLTYAIDSLNKKFNQRKTDMIKESKIYLSILRDSNDIKTIPSSVTAEDPVLIKGNVSINAVMETALSSARNLKTYYENNADELDSKQSNITRFTIEWHRKFTLSIACFILFLIGAPLGAIIRKGGLGMPIVVSIIFFLFFHIASITGEKFAKEGVIYPNEGMWIAPLILLPIGIFLTYKATKDSALFDMDAYLNFFKKLKRKKAV
ncbi:MAG TPA: LptF/LptG family permease [Bacteroidia bacterium]|nr:LptF/LptG family permease [Bacteroidia bacterium]